jgi:hypothetical protein
MHTHISGHRVEQQRTNVLMHAPSSADPNEVWWEEGEPR